MDDSTTGAEWRPETLAVLPPPAGTALRGTCSALERAVAFDPSAADRFTYSRFANPATDATAARLAGMEGAEAALLVASGTAALLAALTAAVPPGGTIAASRMLCGDAHSLLTRTLVGFGRHVELIDIDDAAGWRAAAPRVDALFVEALSNPTLRVADLGLLSGIAQGAGALLVVDSTLATPVNIRPLELGADLVVHSATKALNGHGDVIAGAVCGSKPLIAEVRAAADALGGCLDPGAAWLLERGMKTLWVRVERQNATARGVARALAGHTAVAEVVHPCLPSHPDHVLASLMLGGTAGMLALRIHGGEPAAERLLARLRLIGRAPTLGGVESLAGGPHSGSHSSLDPAERAAAGIPPGLVRLSLGLEDPRDLLEDLMQALDALAPAPAGGR